MLLLMCVFIESGLLSALATGFDPNQARSNYNVAKALLEQEQDQSSAAQHFVTAFLHVCVCVCVLHGTSPPSFYFHILWHTNTHKHAYTQRRW